MNGEGGSYLINEKGEKVLVERTQDPRDQDSPASQPAKKSQKEKGLKDV